MDFEDLCNTGLVLGLGNYSPSSLTSKNPTKNGDHIRKTAEPSLTLSLSGAKKDDSDLYRQDSAASSFPTVSVKREREVRSEDEEEDGPNDRKKLRLSKAQAALLEESFKQHSTLNPKQKQDLARELKLRPRQVEVWFQNRRARTKLKQTELDCEFLKKCCETLTDENRRLHKELQELKLSQPLYMQLPAATLTMCPSCERIGGAVADNTAKTFIKPHFYNPFTNPSAAC
ncbi:hypothetical protein SASPL_141438 [Salvia splendens]|uniref:Homeobox domain-containing protein n=1 Tax=Salvia splendens TaxID=180675 RepID=A0A8X8WRX6_SALSN|nr:homeobox-leucine zipper protein HAT22-like [Salvia splendens]KAG6399952.1 hypothetical protein SASPL_141438 [Salvia splendens]